MSKKIKHLVVDTSAFIKASNLQDLAENVYTIQEVIDEITNDRQRRKLIVLPYDLKVKNVFSENINFVTEFSKKTGDYTSLSATDTKVIALTYQMEKELIGTDHLKSEPTTQKTIKVTGLPNFNKSPESNNATSGKQSGNKKVQDLKNSVQSNNSAHDCDSEPDYLTKMSVDMKNESLNDDETLVEQVKSIDLTDENIDNMMVKVSDEEATSEEDDETDDDGEWITPKNLAEKKKDMDYMGDFEDKFVEVACVTSDFAMQNVLKQIGLNVTSIDGRIIRQLRTFIFRCTTCFKTTSVMTKLFCQKCGHATLKKVAVSIDEHGNQNIHINGRKPLTARGKRFSLPTPRGGQHFQYPILTEDQHIHKKFATKMARKKNNPLDPDYIGGFSPFVMKDVNSKSAVLGVRADKQDVKYWMKHYSKGKKK